MSKKTTAITAGIAMLAGLSAQAQEPLTADEKAEIAADVIQEMVVEGQVRVDGTGMVRVNKGLFDILRERGILIDKDVKKQNRGPDTACLVM